nr:hypothetical protein [Ardenticatena sp.]
MPQNTCPICGTDGARKTYARKRGVFFLLLGFALLAIGQLLLFTWFPSISPWIGNIHPAYDTFVKTLTSSTLVALINALGLFICGFGGWLITTPQFTCQQCQHTWWREPEEEST